MNEYIQYIHTHTHTSNYTYYIYYIIYTHKIHSFSLGPSLRQKVPLRRWLKAFSRFEIVVNLRDCCASKGGTFQCSKCWCPDAIGALTSSKSSFLVRSSLRKSMQKINVWVGFLHHGPSICPHSTGSISNKQQALPTPLFVLICFRSAPYMCKSKTNGKDPKDCFCWAPKNALGDVARGEGRVKLGGFANGEDTSKDSKGWFFEMHLRYRINILLHTKMFSAYTSCFGLKVWSHVLWFVVGKRFDEASFRAPFSGSRNKLQTSFHVKSSLPKPFQ